MSSKVVSSPLRAAVIVTGTEVLSDQIKDSNGPWLSRQLVDLGVHLVSITVVGDRPSDIKAALKSATAQEIDLVVTTGGLGPTEDDLTMRTVADFCQLPMQLDHQLQRNIEEILAPLAAKYPNLATEAVKAGIDKQAHIISGSKTLKPVGTAPGAIVPALDSNRPLIVILPGPPAELIPMWQAAITTDPLADLLTKGTDYRTEIIRMYEVPEPELAEFLREIESKINLSPLEITTCLRKGEIEVMTRYEHQSQELYSQLTAEFQNKFQEKIFSWDKQTIDDHLAKLLEESNSTVAVAESCTAGMLAARLADRPGASNYFKGGLVTYDNTAKTELAGVDPFLIERFGAVSVEVAALLADGAIDRFHADYGIGITGIAGPDGGSEEKPVGRVCISVASKTAERVTQSYDFPGSRTVVRERSTARALQMLHKLITKP